MRAFEFLIEDEVSKPGVSNYAVIFGGRFQPPHKGHNAIYKYLTKNFNPGNVYIATSNKTDKAALDKYQQNLEVYNKRYEDYLNKKARAEERGTKIPPEPKKPNPPQVKSYFSFDEKKAIWTKLFGVPNNNVQFATVPAFDPKEILAKLPDDTAYITVTSEKDKDRYEGKTFYKPYPMSGNVPEPFDSVKDQLYPASEHGYYIILPSLEGGISATKVRDFIQNDKKSVDEKHNFLKSLYGKSAPAIFDLIIKRLNGDW